MQFRPRSPWCFVLAGPDLRATSDRPHPRQRATLWIDAFQLEAADTATDFSPRSPLELGISTDQVGNVFDWNEPQRIQLSVHVRDNGETGFEQSKTGTPARLLGETSTVTDVSDRRLNDGQECPSCLVCGPASCQDSPAGLDQVRVEMRISDLFDRDVWNGTTVPDASGSATVEIPACDQLRGYLRVHATAKCGDLVCQRSMAMAAIPVHHADDSRFGVNHAYPWPHLLDLCRRAGLVWVRDWSAKWQDIEPEPGRFSFDEVDYQIDRPRKHDLQVLGLVPFPSSRWSSSAPEGVGATDRYPDNRRRVAYAPRDVAPFENFVARIVEHYRGRIAWWQVFNEPLFTDYSLPRDAGYDGQDYARWTIAFAQAARRASPDTKILAGIGYLNDGQILDDFRQFFEAGGLAAIDAVDIHHYPRIRPPEFIEEPLAKLGALMETCGGRKPIWLTEYGYYADDESWSTPMPHSGFDQPLPSELVQCEYAVRWAAILFAGGADKIFYHAGTCDGLNRDSLQGIFFEYGGTPHKIYAVQAVMSHLLTARSQFVKRLHFDPATRAYLFRDEARLVCVLWSTAAEQGRSIQLSDDRIQLLDLAGRTQQGRTVVTSETPVYLVAEGLTSEQFAAAVQ